jgi:DNA-binding PadR family transcriptional regulator
VLGALSIEAMSGYEIRRAIESSIGQFWRESFGQIYPTLRKLEQDGLVRQVPGVAGSRRIVYAITPEGERELERLLDEPIGSSPPRNGLLLRLFFGRVLGAARCLDLVRDAEQQAREQLETYDGIERELRSAYGGSPDLDYWLLTVQYGREHALASARFAAHAEEVLGNLGRREEKHG